MWLFVRLLVESIKIQRKLSIFTHFLVTRCRKHEICENETFVTLEIVLYLVALVDVVFERVCKGKVHFHCIINVPSVFLWSLLMVGNQHYSFFDRLQHPCRGFHFAPWNCPRKFCGFVETLQETEIIRKKERGCQFFRSQCYHIIIMFPYNFVHKIFQSWQFYKDM